MKALRPQALCVLWALLAYGCDSCGSAHIAEIVVLESEVDRDFASKVNDWISATKGDRLSIGDGIRTGRGATAELRLVPRGIVRVEGATIVRFQNTPPGQKARRVEVETGAVEVEAVGLELEVQTPAGLARLAPGSKMRVSSDRKTLRIDILVGEVVMERNNGDILAMTAGETYTVDVGTLVILKVIADKPPVVEKPVVAVARDTGPTDAPEPEETPTTEEVSEGAGGVRFDTPPVNFHLTIPAGESPTIHDPRPPTNVRITFSGCSQGGVVELSRGGKLFDTFRARGQHSAVVRVAAGGHRYRVRCMVGGVMERKVLAKGRIFIRRDSGTRKLPRTAPKLTVDADGRRYTVRYQNLLPKITLRWPEPPAGPYTLKVNSPAGRTINANVSSASHALRSGQLGEGTHTFHFTTKGGRRSPTGKIYIAFDNTARTAYLSSPASGEAKPGMVTVAGVALVNSRVSVGSQVLALRGQGRFSEQVTVGAGAHAIAVRVRSSATGLHYYLRHLAQAP